MSLRDLLKIGRSLAFRLTLWYGAIFTVSSGVAFLFFYLLVTTVIDDLTDKDLLEQAEKFTTILTTRGIE
ncbi:MAG: two-component sensor histidine kinase, partial [Thermodesulfobacteriota bacterium]|nr:two-component sensor histidine kinase [Thermodesulfobacteriota bacterium]